MSGMRGTDANDRDWDGDSDGGDGSRSRRGSSLNSSGSTHGLLGHSNGSNGSHAEAHVIHAVASSPFHEEVVCDTSWKESGESAGSGSAGDAIEARQQEEGGSADVPERTLTMYDGVGIIVGIVIGSGIFSSPGLTLERSGSPGAALIAWALAGVLVAFTSQCYFELGCMMPHAGGDYHYLQRAYGDDMAFTFAFYLFFISKSGSWAIMATIFGRYCETAITGNTDFGSNSDKSESALVKVLSITLIIVIALINCMGVKESSVVQNCLTISKIFLVILIFLVATAYAAYQPSYANENLVTESFEGTKSGFSLFSSLIACLWSFDGWADLNFMMEDMREPQRRLPIVVMISLAIVTVAYILANIAYFATLPKDTVMNSPAIAFDSGKSVASSYGGSNGAVGYCIGALPTIFAVGVALSTAGAVNGSVMAGGRAIWGVARDGMLPPILAKTNKAGAPYASLLAQAAWSIVLLLLPGASFSSLLDYFGPASWFFYAMSCTALVRLRQIEPDTYRPYKLPFYPYPVVFVVIIAAVIVISSFAKEPLFTSLAFGFILAAVPVRKLALLYQRTYGEPNPSNQGMHDRANRYMDVNLQGSGINCTPDDGVGHGTSQGVYKGMHILAQDSEHDGV